VQHGASHLQRAPRLYNGPSTARHNGWQHWMLPALLIALTLFRLLVAAETELSPDEAYYWQWSQSLAAGYPDHPPMVALWIALGRFIAGDTPLGVRLLGVLASALGSWMIVKAASDLAPHQNRAERAMVIAPVLLNATIGINAGSIIMTPDTPLLFFWTACLAALARWLATGEPGWWLAFGVAFGAASLSKYTAFLGGLGVLLWLVMVPSLRPTLRTKPPYIAAGIAFVMFLPVLIWNADHDFVSFWRQGGRIGDFTPLAAPRYLAELVLGQALLATPWVLLLFMTGTIAVFKLARRQPEEGLLAATIAVPLAVFAEHAIGARVQANWPVMIYPSLALAAGISGVHRWRAAAITGGVLSFLLMLQAGFGPVPVAVGPLKRLNGWEEFAPAIHRAADGTAATFIAADEYGLASELAYYLHLPIAGIDPRWQHFAFKRAPLDLSHGILVISSKAHEPDPAIWGKAKLVDTITRNAYNRAAEIYRVYDVSPQQIVPNAYWLTPRPHTVIETDN
jgi:4-amino-4-deoxy-L-arabinose transferase-like glycosyltransferase